MVEVAATTTAGRAVVREAIASAAWDHKWDPWGSGMAALGLIVDVMWELGLEVPEDIATPSPMGGGIEQDDDDAWELHRQVVDGAVSIGDLERGMHVANRYTGLAERAGHRY